MDYKKIQVELNQVELESLYYEGDKVSFLVEVDGETYELTIETNMNHEEGV